MERLTALLSRSASKSPAAAEGEGQEVDEGAGGTRRRVTRGRVATRRRGAKDASPTPPTPLPLDDGEFLENASPLFELPSSSGAGDMVLDFSSPVHAATKDLMEVSPPVAKSTVKKKDGGEVRFCCCCCWFLLQSLAN